MSRKVLLVVRCTPSFKELVEAESLLRDLSIQDLIVRALEAYFKTPVKTLKPGVKM